jgi:hypothetical protein
MNVYNPDKFLTYTAQDYNRRTDIHLLYQKVSSRPDHDANSYLLKRYLPHFSKRLRDILRKYDE